MHALINLLLAHLLADFPLQANALYEYKRTSPIGLALHAGVHGLVSALLSRQRLEYWTVWVVVIAVHFLIDWMKLRYHPQREWVGFLIDQLAHFAVLAAIAFWQPSLQSILPSWLLYISFAAAWIPLIVMIMWIYAMGHPPTHPRWAWMKTNLLKISKYSGYPVVGLVLGGLIFS